MDELKELIKEWALAKEGAEAAEALRKKWNNQASAIEADIAKKWDALGLGTTCDIEGAPIVQRLTRMTVKTEDKDALSEWLKATGREAMGTYSVHNARLKSFCKEVLEEGGEIPDGVKVSHHSYLKLAK